MNKVLFLLSGVDKKREMRLAYHMVTAGMLATWIAAGMGAIAAEQPRALSSPSFIGMTYKEVLAHSDKPYTFEQFIAALEAVQSSHESFTASSYNAERRSGDLVKALAGPGMNLPVRSTIFPKSLIYDSIEESGDAPRSKDNYPFCGHLYISFTSYGLDGLCQDPLGVSATRLMSRLGTPEEIPENKFFVVDGTGKLPPATNKLGSKIFRFNGRRVEYIVVTRPDGQVSDMRFSISIQ